MNTPYTGTYRGVPYRIALNNGGWTYYLPDKPNWEGGDYCNTHQQAAAKAECCIDDHLDHMKERDQLEAEAYPSPAD